MTKANPTDSLELTTYVTAKGYRRAAQIVHNHSTSEVEALSLFLPLHLLLGFALELYLKAWLLRSKIPPNELKAKLVRHDLLRLYSMALAKGLTATDHLRELVDHLHEPHLKFRYRYADPSSIFKGTNVTLALAVLRELDMKVDAAVGASVAYGLKPGH
jgi:hypothetical protein